MTEVVKVNINNPNREILKDIADDIREGRLVIYPTETVYGLGGNASDDEAAEKVFEVKQRSRDKPISIAVNDLSMTYYACKVTKDVERLIHEFLPGPLTIVAEKRPSISDVLSADTDKIGIRIPDHSIARDIIDLVRRPITTTSANISGGDAPVNVEEAIDQIGSDVELAVDAGTCELKESSTVVDVTGDKVELIREGPISESDILAVL